MYSDSSPFDNTYIKYTKFYNITKNFNNFPNWEEHGPCNKKRFDSLALVYVFIVHYEWFLYNLPVAN